MSNEIKNEEVKEEVIDMDEMEKDIDTENVKETEAVVAKVEEESFLSKAGNWMKTKALPATGKILKKAVVGAAIGFIGYKLGQKMTENDGSYDIEPSDIDNNGIDYYDIEPVDTVDLPDTDFSVSDVEVTEDTEE